MAEFISQKEKSSGTDRTRQRTNFISPLDPKIRDSIAAYFQRNPWGTHVTLQVLEDLGKNKIEELMNFHDKDLGEIKQCIGLRIPILLCDLLGQENVFTYRDPKTYKNSKRPVPADYSDLMGWVSSYTPHKIRKEWMEDYMNGIIDAVKLGIKEYENLKVDNDVKYLDGYLQGLLVMLDTCDHKERDLLKEKLSWMQSSLY